MLALLPWDLIKNSIDFDLTGAVVNIYNVTLFFCFRLQGDDDVFVNMQNIVDFLLSLSPEKGKNLFTGSVLYPSPRIKDPKSKYYVPSKLWPEKYYPPYVSGGGFLMSSVVAKKIFEVRRHLFSVDGLYCLGCIF